MIGGLLSKSTSHVALLAAAGFLIAAPAVPSARAADLGGDCCADLEERVAELEATTARKGNRKMSLTVYGAVNRSILYWNDGSRSNTAIGLDNHSYASRFGFMGNAKISPAWSAGYSLLLDVADKARTSGVGQQNEEGSTRGNPNVESRNEDHLVRLRDANVWIEHKAAGRLTLGRITNEGQNGLIDLAGTTAGTGSDPACTGGGVAFRNKSTGLIGSVVPAAIGQGTAGIGTPGTTISNLSENCGGPFGIRMEGLKYTSPAVAGFIFAASVGESFSIDKSTIDDPNGQLTNLGRQMGLSLKYAGEFSGFRIAAGAGYERSQANEQSVLQNSSYGNGSGFSAPDTLLALGGSTNTGAAGFGTLGTGASADSRYAALAGSLMHVPTGLFVQGHYTWLTQTAQNPITGQFDGPDRDARRWDIQGGISKNWWGIGNTVLYGEYQQHNNMKFAAGGYGLGTAGPAGCPVTGGSGTPCIVNSPTANTLTKGDELSVYGLGLVQNVDAAAMELYVSWRHFSAKDPQTTANTAATVGSGTATLAVTAVGYNPNGSKFEDVDIIMAGARIKF
jgi:hypothetical protein